MHPQMPKLKLLILDANVVIYLHQQRLWKVVLESCDVHLSRIVADQEVRFYDGPVAQEVIDLGPDIASGACQVFDVDASDLKRFRDQFDLSYLGDLDDGEAESLAFMFSVEGDHTISSADAIVFRVLGNLGQGDRGLSLEEILQKIGRGRGGLPWQYTKAFRENYTGIGQQDMIQGRGRKR